MRLSTFASLKELTPAGRGVVLIVDEAHLLSDRLLEELRLLASLSEGKLPLARVILAGQPALEERLMEPGLEALNQRVACQVYLEALTRRQSIDYVNYRIEWAGGETSRIFTEAALERIAVCAGGLPRCLNQLCDHAMLLTCVQEQSRVTNEIVDEALGALRQLPLHWNIPVAAGQVSKLSGNQQRIEEASDEDLSELTTTAAAPGDVSSDGLQATASYAGAGETACIEIGGEVAISNPVNSDIQYADSESFAEFDEPVLGLEETPMLESPVSMMRGRPGAGVVPLPDASPQAMRGMVDEVVVDRYAMLDSSGPRIMRTFDDSAVPECWLPVKQNDIPAAPQPPVWTGADAVWSSADIVIEEISDEIEVDILDSLDAMPQHVDSLELKPVGPEPIDIDDLLGSSVMDACLEVQAVIDGETPHGKRDAHWWNDPVVAADDDQIVMHEAVESFEAEYDVVEPEQGALGENRQAARHDARHDGPLSRQPREETPAESCSSETSSQGRYVPKPKYRNIFSTLRRRIARGM